MLLVFTNKKLNFIKPIKAVFTNTPLKNIEKLVLASTCVFNNQKLKGHNGSFIEKLINIKYLIIFLYGLWFILSFIVVKSYEFVSK